MSGGLMMMMTTRDKFASPTDCMHLGHSKFSISFPRNSTLIYRTIIDLWHSVDTRTWMKLKSATTPNTILWHNINSEHERHLMCSKIETNDVKLAQLNFNLGRCVIDGILMSDFYSLSPFRIIVRSFMFCCFVSLEF